MGKRILLNGEPTNVKGDCSRCERKHPYKIIYAKSQIDIYIEGYVQAMVNMAVAKMTYSTFDKEHIQFAIYLFHRNPNWPIIEYEVCCMIALLIGIE